MSVKIIRSSPHLPYTVSVYLPKIMYLFCSNCNFHLSSGERQAKLIVEKEVWLIIFLSVTSFPWNVRKTRSKFLFKLATGAPIVIHVARDKIEYFQFLPWCNCRFRYFFEKCNRTICRQSCKDFVSIIKKDITDLESIPKKVQTWPRCQKISCTIHWSAAAKLLILNSKR